MGFDPKEYIAQNTSSGFDPKSYIEAHGGTSVETDPNELKGQALIDFMRSGQDQSARGRAMATPKPDLPMGAKDNPFESDLYGSEGDRAKASFGNDKGVGRMLKEKQFVDVDRNSNGDLVAKDAQGNWHKDQNNFFAKNPLNMHPLNWAASGTGKSLPMAAGIGAAALASESGPGAIAAAVGGGAGGEAVRSSIGRRMGVYDGDAGDQAIDAAKEGLQMGIGEGVGRYAINPMVHAASPYIKAGADEFGGALKNGAFKTAEVLTKVPKELYEEYAKDPAAIEALAKENDYDPQAMADAWRERIGNKVHEYRQAQNNKISAALKGANPDQPIEVTSVLDRLRGIREGLDPSMDKEDVKDLDDLIGRLENSPKVRTKENVAVGYDAPNEKQATVTSQIAAGGPQKKFILHEPGEPYFPDEANGEVANLGHDMTGQRSVPVVDTSLYPSLRKSPVMPPFSSPEAERLITSQNEIPQSLKGAPIFEEHGSPTFKEEPLYGRDLNPADKVVDFPIGKQELQSGEKSIGRPQQFTDLPGLQRITKWLQKQGETAYGGTPLGFKVGDAGANAAKGAAGEGRALLNQATEYLPEAQAISDANARLERLHGVEEHMNPRLLEQKATPASLYAGGAGDNPQVQMSLQDLGKEIGYDVQGDARKLAAARAFGNPQYLPMDTTGKSLSRMGLAAGAGVLAGSVAGLPLVPLAAAGALASSPAVWKQGIKGTIAVGNVSKAIINQPWFQYFVKNPELLNTVGNPAMRQLISTALDDVRGRGEEHGEDAHYDPSGEKAQPMEVSKQKFLQGN